MKTKIFTLITMVALLISTTSLTYANTKTNNETAVLTDVSNFNKIEVRGNVEIYLTNGAKDGVKVYDNYYGQNALVQTEGGVLRISSYNKEKLVVLVTVRDLREIAAYDNATIKTDGKLLLLDLNVKLNNNAGAQLNIDAMAVNITVNDRATADLSGTITDYQLAYSQSSSVNRTELEAVYRTEKVIPLPHQKTKHPHLLLAEAIASL